VLLKLISLLIYICKKENLWKGEMIKIRLRKGEMSNNYLIHVYRQPRSTGRPERRDRKQELSASTEVPFILR